mmetsp:Transcript_5498/g.13464  ORF Transcript_5498/g.13464 Transcript_5498/m.13464 type:complete len:109 (+) Transcript_5498:295-621(+)
MTREPDLLACLLTQTIGLHEVVKQVLRRCSDLQMMLRAATSVRQTTSDLLQEWTHREALECLWHQFQLPRPSPIRRKMYIYAYHHSHEEFDLRLRDANGIKIACALSA